MIEIPDYEDIHEINQKIDRLEKKFDKLVECLPIDKHFVINGIKFNTRVDVEDFIRKQREDFLKTYPGSSGSFYEPEIKVFPGK